MPTAMTAKRRGKAVASSRRRRQDDGEEDEEGSVMAELLDDSLSEGSVISNGDDDADVEQSDASEEEVRVVDTSSKKSLATRLRSRASAPNLTSTKTGAITTADAPTVTNGLQTEDVKSVSAVDSDEVAPQPLPTAAKDEVPPPKASKETLGERNRREHMEYLKQKKENPAFVPNRGGFFLHDNRAAPSGAAGYRSVQRGRGRGFGNGFHQRYAS